MIRSLPTDWRPEPVFFEMLQQLNIPAEFAQEQLPEFVLYWSERGTKHHAWGNKFLKHCQHEWRMHEIKIARGQKESPMQLTWCPAKDAVDVLAKDGIPVSFIHGIVSEFILYWRDRGDASSTWNSKFIAHARFKWNNRGSGLPALPGSGQNIKTSQRSLIDDLSDRSWATPTGGNNDQE